MHASGCLACLLCLSDRKLIRSFLRISVSRVLRSLFLAGLIEGLTLITLFYFPCTFKRQHLNHHGIRKPWWRRRAYQTYAVSLLRFAMFLLALPFRYTPSLDCAIEINQNNGMKEMLNSAIVVPSVAVSLSTTKVRTIPSYNYNHHPRFHEH